MAYWREMKKGCQRPECVQLKKEGATLVKRMKEMEEKIKDLEEDLEVANEQIEFLKQESASKISVRIATQCKG